jgi:hypothetical protein
MPFSQNSLGSAAVLKRPATRRTFSPPSPFLLTMDLEFTGQGNLKVYMNLGKAIAYFLQLAEMMAPVRPGAEL